MGALLGEFVRRKTPAESGRATLSMIRRDRGCPTARRFAKRRRLVATPRTTPLKKMRQSNDLSARLQREGVVFVQHTAKNG
jgi:hypothetical protein